MSEPIPVGPRRGLFFPAQEWLDPMEEWELLSFPDQDALLAAVSESVGLAETGNGEAGHEILRMGLQQAEDRWKGNPWGWELVLCYQEGLARYERTYRYHGDHGVASQGSQPDAGTMPAAGRSFRQEATS